MSSVPSWKRPLLEKKRRQDEEDRRRHAERLAQMSEMPPWKRDLILKKKGGVAISNTGVTEKNVVIIDRESSARQTDTVNGKVYYPEFGGSQRTTPDSGFDETEESAHSHRSGHATSVQDNLWVETKTTSHNQGGAVVENGSSACGKGDSDEELPYQPGFVHKLLNKFSHLTVSSNAQHSQGGVGLHESGSHVSAGRRSRSQSFDNPDGSVGRGSRESSANSSPRYTENDDHSQPSTCSTCLLTGIDSVDGVHDQGRSTQKNKLGTEKVASLKENQNQVSENLKPVQKSNKKDSVVTTDVKILQHSDGNKSTSAPAIDIQEKKTLISVDKQDVEDMPTIKNIVSSYRNMFESGKKTKAPQPRTAEPGGHQSVSPLRGNFESATKKQSRSDVLQDYTPRSNVLSSKQNSAGISKQKSEGQAQECSEVKTLVDDVKPIKGSKKGPSPATIKKIRESGQSWYYGKSSSEQTNALGANFNDSNDMIIIESSPEINIKPEAEKSSKTIELKGKAEPPRNIEIKQTIQQSSSTSERGLKPTSSKSVKQNESQSTSETRKRAAPLTPAQSSTPPAKSKAPPPPVLDSASVSNDDSQKIIITDTDDDIPVTNIDDMLLDLEEDIDDQSNDSRKAAPPPGIDTHLDLSSIVNEDNEPLPEVKPAPVKPCRIKFIGDNVKLEKSALKKTKNTKSNNIKFTEQAEICEYPSEQTMMEFFPFEGDEHKVSQTTIADGTTTHIKGNNETERSGESSLLSNPAVNPTGSVLGSYKSKIAGEYELGTTPPSKNLQKTQSSKPVESTPDDLHIKPADEDDTFAWSDSANADMLF